jgi:hypothetical protein
VSLDTQAKKLQEILENIRTDFITDLTMVDLGAKATRKEGLKQQRIVEEKVEANKREFRAQLEEVNAVAERASRPAACTSTAQPPTFNGNTSWSMLQCHYESVAEHNQWSDQEESTYSITALKGPAADLLHGIPTNTTYEETLQAQEDRFRDQHFAATYRCQLTTRTQKAGESLQDFATAVEQITHHAYPTLPEDHVWREAGKAFAYRVEDPNIKIELLLGGENTINEALRQALELQAVLVAARPHKNSTKTYQGSQSPTEEMQSNRDAGAIESGPTLSVAASMKGRLIMSGAENMKIGQAETCGNRQEGRNGNQVTMKKQAGGVVNSREISEDQWRRVDAGICIKASPSHIDCDHRKCQS